MYNNTNWLDLNFSVSDMDFALQINPGLVNTGGTNLSQFHARGGKIIAYHGRNDEVSTLFQLELWLSMMELTATRPSRRHYRHDTLTECKIRSI